MTFESHDNTIMNVCLFFFFFVGGGGGRGGPGG